MGEPERLPKALDLLDALCRGAQNKPILGKSLDCQRTRRAFDHRVWPVEIRGLENPYGRITDGRIRLLQTVSYKDVAHQGDIGALCTSCGLLPSLPEEAHTGGELIQPRRWATKPRIS